MRSFDSSVPDTRVRVISTQPVNDNGRYILYWMTSARRLGWNFGLQRAVDWAVHLDKPLVILEAVRCDYPGANDRLHRFILDGMAVNAAVAAKAGVRYHPYVEPSPDHGKELLAALSSEAALVVTDWYPAFFLPRMTAAAGRKSSVAMEAVDSNGLIPLACQKKPFTMARAYRAFVQRSLKEHVTTVPEETPLARLQGLPAAVLPASVLERWPAADDQVLSRQAGALAMLPIDHGIAPVETRGGSQSARRALTRFISAKLDRYADDHNHPDADGTSRLSPYLHFGHISAHEVFGAVMTHEKWTSRKLGATRVGAREGWWGVSASAEQFLDQLVVWRELAFNGCEYQSGGSAYESLPAWARDTLEKHQRDPRAHQYSLEQLETARTHDIVWNAAQRQLLTEGWFHGYLRMLWGKKIFEWSADGPDALARMQSIMDRYSLDGRDPNSYASYAWVLGRYDRPWPERPIFGTVRCMTSDSARRKLKMKRFLEQYGERSLLF